MLCKIYRAIKSAKQKNSKKIKNNNKNQKLQKKAKLCYMHTYIDIHIFSRKVFS